MIFGVALNFSGVSDNKTNPLIFCKGDDRIQMEDFVLKVSLPSQQNLWPECELGLRISRDLQIGQAVDQSVIKSVFVASDITCSSLEGHDHHLIAQKGRLGFFAKGQEVELDASNSYFLTKSLAMRSFIDDRLVQDGLTGEMILDPLGCVENALKFFPIKKNDIILCGTPPGWNKSFVSDRATVTHKIEGLPDLVFSIVRT